MQTCSELERKAVPAQGGHLQSELRDTDLLLLAQGRAAQPPSSRTLGTQTHQAKGVLFLEWPGHLPRAQQAPRDFWGLTGNLPLIPSAEQGWSLHCTANVWRSKVLLFWGKDLCQDTLSFAFPLSLSFAPPGARGRMDKHYLKKNNLAAWCQDRYVDLTSNASFSSVLMMWSLSPYLSEQHQHVGQQQGWEHPVQRTTNIPPHHRLHGSVSPGRTQLPTPLDSHRGLN